MRKQFKIHEGKIIEDFGADPCPILMYIAPDEAEKKHLIENYSIDEHTLLSALDPDELGRLEIEPQHIAIIFKRPKRYSSEDNFLFKVSSAGFFVFPDKLILVLADDPPFFEGRYFNRVRSLTDLLLRVIYRYILHFEEHLRIMSAISDELEQEIVKAMENKHLLHLFTLEKGLVYYLNAINSNAKAIERLKVNAPKLAFSQENTEFLDDVLIENSQCYEQANTYSQVLSSLMDARVSIVNNNLNMLMKELTLVMIAIMLPNFVVSVFSMNLKLPLVQEGSSMSFWFVILLSISTAGAVYFYWRYRK